MTGVVIETSSDLADPVDGSGQPSPAPTGVLGLLDGVADQYLDVEHRTAMRRFLARVAAADPAFFRRRASVERGAADVAWAVCRAVEAVGWCSESRATGRRS